MIIHARPMVVLYLAYWAQLIGTDQQRHDSRIWGLEKHTMNVEAGTYVPSLTGESPSSLDPDSTFAEIVFRAAVGLPTNKSDLVYPGWANQPNGYLGGVPYDVKHTKWTPTTSTLIRLLVPFKNNKRRERPDLTSEAHREWLAQRQDWHYILLCGEPPIFRYHGWIEASTILRPENLTNPGDGWCYALRDSTLHQDLAW